MVKSTPTPINYDRKSGKTYDSNSQRTIHTKEAACKQVAQT